MSEYDKIADRATRVRQWKPFNIRKNHPQVIECDGEWVATADTHRVAHLMVAAPDLLAALEGMQQANGCFDTCRWEYSGRHHAICIEATYAIAKARGSV